MECNRRTARWHGDEQYAQIACTCSLCAALEAADDWLDWLAQQHPELDDQWRWYDLVAWYGYELPENVWQHVAATISDWQQQDIEMAERRAGWDPNP